MKEAPERDNPGGRQQWMDQWYNENYGQSGEQARSRLFRQGLWTPEYQRFMLQAAKRERDLYRSKMPESARGTVVIDPRWPIMARRPADTASASLRWTNIGPTQATFARNGNVRLAATDTGRVRNIVSDPANPNTLYVAFAGGGLWRSLDGGAFWQPMTETIGSLSVGALAMDPNNAATLYLGLGDPFDGTGTGIIKMTDRGETWADPAILGDSSNIRDILVPPSNSNIVLVATNRGLYRSINGGRDYAQVPIGINQNLAIWSIAHGAATVTNGVNTHTIVLTLQTAAGTGQIWRSTDSGATWTQAIGIAAAARRISIASAPSNRNTMYAMAARQAPADNAATQDIDESRSDLNNIYRSTDGGANWTAIATNAAGTYLTYSNPIASPNPASWPNWNLEYRSVGYILGGQGWYNHAVTVDPANADVVYFGGTVQLVRADIFNNAWRFTRMSDWLGERGEPYVHSDMHNLHINNGGGQTRLYVGTDGGIFRSPDNGNTFTDALNVGIASHLVYNVCSTPNNAARVLVGLQDNGTRLREANTAVFNQVIGGDGFGCNVNAANGDNMLGSLYNTRIQRSTDGGLNFNEVCFAGRDANGFCNPIPNSPFRTNISAWAGSPNAATPPNGNTVYTHTDNTIYRSTDYFATWATLGTTGLPADRIIRGIASARTNNTRVPVNGVLPPDNDDVMGVILNNGRIFLTTTGGRQTVVNGVNVNGWSAAAALPSIANVNDGNYHRTGLSSIAFDPTDSRTLYVTSVTPNANAAHVWRSTDFGRNWAIIDGTGTPNGNGFPRGIPVNSITVDHVVRQTLYAATHLGVYRSRDSGTTWERFGAWLPLVNVTDVQVAADGNTARAATFGRGVWEMSDITNNVAPVANFNTTTSGLTATFTNTSTDSDGTIARTIWNFGDGISSSMASPNHTYAQSGTYTVTLTVTDNGGLSHTRTAQVTVSNNAAPVANFTFTTANLTANFTDSSTDSDGTIASRSWNFGDGTTSTLASPSKTYASAGTYTVTLTVTDNGGLTNTRSQSVTVTAPPANAAPVANFNFTTANLTANFTDSSTDSDGSIASRSWDFGDGTSSTLTNPSKTYASAGTYNVRLTVTDNAGATHSVTRAVTVTAAPVGNVLTNGVAVTDISLAADLTRTWTMVVPAGATNLRFVTSGGTGDADLYVQFGSAPTTTTYGCRSWVSGNNESCSITPVQAGTYHVMVHAFSAISGVTLTGSFTAPSGNVAPTANFNVATSGLTATFTDTSTDSDGTIASRSWNFGDGTTSTATNPSRTYTAAGTYTVTLTVTDNAGATHTTTRSVTVAAATTQTYSNTTAIAIPDNNAAGATRTIVVSGRTGNAPANASIAVNISHSFIGDLVVDLIAPDGTVYNLHNRAGGATANLVQTYTRDLSTETLNGTWSLRASDVDPAISGTLNSWSITF